jgi:hypothetical protein
VRKDQASVDFLDPRGAPIRRSYMKGAPSVNMVARYDDYHETFEVDLGKRRARGGLLGCGMRVSSSASIDAAEAFPEW